MTEFQELPVACHLHGIPRATFDARAEEGDVPKVRVVAGCVVVDAAEFRAWALRVRAEESSTAEGGCCDG